MKTLLATILATLITTTAFAGQWYAPDGRALPGGGVRANATDRALSARCKMYANAETRNYVIAVNQYGGVSQATITEQWQGNYDLCMNSYGYQYR